MMREARLERIRMFQKRSSLEKLGRMKGDDAGANNEAEGGVSHGSNANLRLPFTYPWILFPLPHQAHLLSLHYLQSTAQQPVPSLLLLLPLPLSLLLLQLSPHPALKAHAAVLLHLMMVVLRHLLLLLLLCLLLLSMRLFICGRTR